MNVRKCIYTLVLEFDRNPGLPTRLLDQDGFPWETVFSSGDPVTGLVTMGIKPLRADPPSEVHEVFAWDERLPLVMARRVYDYMAHLEALDWRIDTIFTNPKNTIVLNFDRGRLATDTACPEGSVSITSGGFLWGPMPLLPLEPPAKWPFQAKAVSSTGKALTLKPTCGGQRMEVSLALEESGATMSANLPWQDAIGFASMVSKEGWERAVATFYPHGVRLTGGRPGGEIDETQVGG